MQRRSAGLSLVGKSADLALYGISTTPPMRMSAQNIDCIIEKRRAKPRLKKLDTEILVVYFGD